MVLKSLSTGLLVVGMMATAPLSALESAAYETLLSDGGFELRQYESQIRVETEVEGDFKGAGNQAFRNLFNYISGENAAQQKIAMTAPVSQDSSEKISMTTPVSQDISESGSWRVGFLVPAEYTAETVPVPTNPVVKLRQIPAQKMVSVRYSGTWSEENYMQHLQSLQAWMKEKGLAATGSPTWARYDSPFKPWFLRRNEILIPVEATDSSGSPVAFSSDT
jgi:effector-binding domain-containing protein